MSQSYIEFQTNKVIPLKISYEHTTQKMELQIVKNTGSK